jgi:hypothetical protein
MPRSGEIMFRIIRWAIGGVLVVSRSDCGTMLNVVKPPGHDLRKNHGRMEIHGGIDMGVVSEAEWPWTNSWAFLVMSVEFPPSLRVDTATLPVTAPATFSN